MIINFRLPEPEPLRHNISNYINTAKKLKSPSTRSDEDENHANGNTDNEEDIFVIRESEIGPEVTHIYQIENKVLTKI